MLGYINKIREISARILKESRVDMVIGFRKGSVPMMNEPCCITRAEDADQLVWDANCGINLANYLTNRKEKIGVVAKGCDSRNIVVHITENKIKRDQLYIIGVPCKGMVDRHKVALRFAGEILEVSEAADNIILKGAADEKRFEKKDVLQENCAVCAYRNPVVSDELVSAAVPEQKDIDRYEDVRRIEAMTPGEKWNFFENLLSLCIRCYACRNACPLCYCPTCFVDESRPQWLGKGQDPIDTRTFHFLRAFHCAGRCTDCGSCERACPVGINMRLFTKKLEKDCLEQFGWTAGLSMEQHRPLDTYRPDDPDDFIR
jgi:formate dehydrogenase subunit beta